jgi:hypothetical protein
MQMPGGVSGCWQPQRRNAICADMLWPDLAGEPKDILRELRLMGIDANELFLASTARANPLR